ncbi:hypothetical protein KUTeg_022157 [Tegillarca granosa]|uniref:Major facilitator superfamily (MFS) profile domain-containing protein n=1 Tax=Tegillarca granosa TaxID=220873 RepID=A0ABQ9E5E7_TEGGR|nr:hypothetical protein KUTeg_022157 [Tegillarca granosa]
MDQYPSRKTGDKMDEQKTEKAESQRSSWRTSLTPYNIYVLFLLLVTYLLNQLDRYMLPITTKSVAQDIHYGDQVCMVNTSFTSAEIGDTKCSSTDRHNEAGCTPFAASIIADYFNAESRGFALGIYNWGIYMGYSMSYAFGNFITEANINNQGWRWSFIFSGAPGFLIGILILTTLKEPERQKKPEEKKETQVEGCSRFARILKKFLNPSLILLCIAGSIRNASGYVFGNNSQVYFQSIGQTKDQIGEYMSWIPIVGGSLSVTLGGFISDRVVKRLGMYARVIVIVVSLLVAAPFAAGTLYFEPPYAYICQIPTYLFGEMWIGITLAIILELVPSDIRTSAVAIYLFIITNIGGNTPLLVPPIKKHFQSIGYTGKGEALRAALYILYPGPYVYGAGMYLLVMFVLKRDQRRAKLGNYVEMGVSSQE